MDIKDIIGEGKIFEPPFKAEFDPLYLDVFLRDANGNLLFIAGDLRQMYYDERNIFAQHICDLLNREHGEKGGQQ